MYEDAKHYYTSAETRSAIKANCENAVKHAVKFAREWDDKEKTAILKACGQQMREMKTEAATDDAALKAELSALIDARLQAQRADLDSRLRTIESQLAELVGEHRALERFAPMPPKREAPKPISIDSLSRQLAAALN